MCYKIGLFYLLLTGFMLCKLFLDKQKQSPYTFTHRNNILSKSNTTHIGGVL